MSTASLGLTGHGRVRRRERVERRSQTVPERVKAREALRRAKWWQQKRRRGEGGRCKTPAGHSRVKRTKVSAVTLIIHLLISDELTVHTDEPPCDHGEVAEMHPLTYERRRHSVHGTVAFPGQSIHSQDRID